MKTLYIDNTSGKYCSCSAYIVDAQNNIKKYDDLSSNIKRMFVADDDMEIRTIPTKRNQTVFKASKGDIILTFYNQDSDKIAIVKNKEWKDMIADELAKRAERQARLETEAKYSDCGDCNKCETIGF